MSQPNPGGATASPAGYQAHQYGEPDALRQSKNTHNVAQYFLMTPGQKILHIAAGDHVYPGALSEDVNQYQDKAQPKLLAAVGEDLDQYLPADSKFGKVVVINPLNLMKKDLNYAWVFQLSSKVMESAATLTLATFDPTRPSMVWAIANEHVIRSFGKAKASPTSPGIFEPVSSDIAVMRGSVAGGPGRGMISYSMATGVQVVWRMN